MILYAEKDNAAAFRELYERYAPRLQGYLVNKLRKRDDAQVVFQETFLKLHAARHTYNPKFAFAQWLFAIAYHALVDFKRRQNSQEKVPEVIDDTGMETPMGIPHQALGQLSEAQRSAVSMRFLDEKTFGQIAEHLHRSESDVRQLVSRGIRRLRKILKV